MKVNDVPQDGSDIKTYNSTRINYALDKDGKYVSTESSGWYVNVVVMNNLQDYFDEKAEDAKQRFFRNETSPLEYFMHHFGVDLQTLSKLIKIPKRKIKKHFKPEIFNKLDDNTLKIYADFFRIDIKTIKEFGKENE